MDIIEENGRIWYMYYEPIEVLNVEYINNISHNMHIIRDLLFLKDFPALGIEDIEASKDTMFVRMRDILQTIENNLSALSQNEAESIYYVEHKEIGEYASNREDIWRWIQILNEMYNILMGKSRKWFFLLCEDGFPTIRRKKIIVKGDYVG